MARHRNEAENAVVTRSEGQNRFQDGDAPFIFGSDVSHRMVDFAQQCRAGWVAHAIEFQGGDALQRMPRCVQPGIMLLNPPTASALPPPVWRVSGPREGRRAAWRPASSDGQRWGGQADAPPPSTGQRPAFTAWVPGLQPARTQPAAGHGPRAGAD